MTREATLCQNILNPLRIFARISKFRCFHETKQTQNDVGKFFYSLAEFVFKFFGDSRRILATFAKFCLNSLFATWSYRYPNPKHVIHRALALPLSPTQVFDTTETVQYKHLPRFATNWGLVVEKLSDVILCLFGFMKAMKFRDSSEHSQCVLNVLAKSCVPCQIIYKPEKKFSERGKA